MSTKGLRSAPDGRDAGDHWLHAFEYDSDTGGSPCDPVSFDLRVSSPMELHVGSGESSCEKAKPCDFKDYFKKKYDVNEKIVRKILSKDVASRNLYIKALNTRYSATKIYEKIIDSDVKSLVLQNFDSLTDDIYDSEFPELDKSGEAIRQLKILSRQKKKKIRQKSNAEKRKNRTKLRHQSTEHIEFSAYYYDLKNKNRNLQAESGVDFLYNNITELHERFKNLLSGLNIPQIEEDLSGILIDTALFYVSFTDARTMSGQIAALLAFLKSQRNLVSLRTGAWKTFTDQIVSKFSSYLHDRKTRNIQPESFSKVRNVLDFFKGIVDSDLVNTIKEMILSLASVKFFSEDISPTIKKYLGSKKKIPLGSLFVIIAEGLGDLLTLTEQAWNRGSILGFLNKENPIKDALEQSTELLLRQNYLTNVFPKDGYMLVNDYLSKCTELIDFFNTCVGSNGLSTKSDVRQKVVIMKQQLVNSFNEIYSTFKAARRIEPLCFVAQGLPGVGKTNFMNAIMRTCLESTIGRYDPQMVFTRTDEEYWEGISNFDHRAIYMPELASAHPLQMMQKGDARIAEFNRLVSSDPFRATMAFKEKGKVFLDPMFVFGDSNTYGLNFNKILGCAEAGYRRVLFIRARVIDRFASGDKIDFKKSIDDESNILDRYVFTLYRITGRGEDRIIDGANIYDFCTELAKIAKCHFSDKQELHERFKTAEDEVSAYVKDQFHPFEDEKNYSPPGEDLRTEGAIDWFEELFPSIEIFPPNLAYNVFSFIMLFLLTQMTRIPKAMYVFMVLQILCRLLLYFLPWYVLQFITTILVLCIRKYGATFSFKKYVVIMIMKSFCHLPDRYAERFSQVKYTFSSCQTMKDRLLRQRDYLKHLVFGNDFNLFYTQYLMGNKRVLVAFGFVTSALCLIYKFKPKYRKVVDVEMSVFSKESSFNEPLSKYEQELEAGNSVTRVKINNCSWGRTNEVKFFNIAHKSKNNLSITVNRNLRRVLLDYPEEDIPSGISNVLGVCGDLALINRHALSLKSPTIVKVSNSGGIDRAIDRFYDTRVEPGKWFEVNSDTVLIRLNQIAFKDIRVHFQEDIYKGICKGVFRNNIVNVTGGHSILLPITITRIENVPLDSCYEYKSPHREGDCGSPLIITLNGGQYIAGIHCAGDRDSDRCYALPLKRSSIEEGVISFRQKSGYINIVSQSAVDYSHLDLPVSKSAVRYMDTNGMDYYGKLPGPVMAKGSSKLVRQAFSKEISELFEKEFNYYPPKEDRFYKPIMKATTIEGEYCNPFNIFLTDAGTTRKCLDTDVLDDCINEATNYILKALDKDKPFEIKPLDIETAVNGSTFDEFLRRINRSTSAGFGLGGIKRDHFTEDEINCEPLNHLKEEIKLILDSYEVGHMADYIFEACLKDEPVKWKKFKTGKTRVFCSGPLAALVVSRMFLAPIYTAMLENSFAFCCALGINAHKDGEVLKDYLISFSEHFLEGDYGGYDKKMPYEIGLAAATVIRRIAEHGGYNRKSLKFLDGVLSDLLFPKVTVLKDLFQIPGLIPSGMYGTAEMNCIRGLILLLYAWKKSAPNNEPFFDYCRPITYGDDVIVSIKKEALKWFSNNHYQRYCEDMFGMEYTSADKSADLKPFLRFSEISFLKRRFRNHPELNKTVMPLSIGSLRRALIWTLPSKHESPEAQMLQTVGSILREFFFHCDKVQYTRIRMTLVDIVSRGLDLDEGSVSNASPTWHELYDVFSDE